MNAATPAPPFDLEAAIASFPALTRRAHGRRLAYLDNAATTFAPDCVIEAVAAHMRDLHGPVHRAVHTCGADATDAYEQARHVVARFLGAAQADEIVFVRGVTEAINLLAHALGATRLKRDDRVIVTTMEHHSNLLPWMQVCAQHGAELRMAPLTPRGEIDLEQFASLLNDRTRIVAFTHISNVLGVVNPVATMCDMARRVGAITVIDGAQAPSRRRVNVRELGCDFYAISGHKMHGPTGIGALWGRAELLSALLPWQTGGSMVEHVMLEGDTTWAPAPMRFEAGTPNSAGAAGLAAAIAFLEQTGLDAIARHESDLTSALVAALNRIDGVHIHGDPDERAGIVSFTVDGVHPHDLATMLDFEGVAVRAGHHCAQPLIEWLGVTATSRASVALYNRPEDVDALADGVRQAIRKLR